MANVDEIRKYFHFEDQLHPYDYENKEQLKKESKHDVSLDEQDSDDDVECKQSEQKTQIEFEKHCQHPVADHPYCCSCWIKYFSIRNTFRGLLKLFFWEISRLSQYTHFYYRLAPNVKRPHNEMEDDVDEVANKNDKVSDDGKKYNCNQWDYNSLLQHFIFVPKQRSKYLRPLVLDYDLYSYSLRIAQSHTSQSLHQCNSRIIVLGQGATLLYFLNYLVVR